MHSVVLSRGLGEAYARNRAGRYINLNTFAMYKVKGKVVTGNIRKDDRRNIISYQGIVKDITERKRAEE